MSNSRKTDQEIAQDFAEAIAHDRKVQAERQRLHDAMRGHGLIRDTPKREGAAQ
jgi:hypothetical protein